jgi:site-specific DNA-methyltransferase (cytosine-N4-specific)
MATTEPEESTLMTGDPDVTAVVDAEEYYTGRLGAAYLGDSRELLDKLEPESVDLVVTSPPFALRKKKDYGNKDASEYNEWFMEFAEKVYEVLKPSGSFVVDIGGGWTKGEPTRSLYHFELLTKLAGSDGPFHLAQDCYWYNPAKLPTPAQWVTIERIRITDAVNHVWWLSKTERPEADNTRVLQEYSDSQKDLMENGYKDKKRPSGHDISDKFDNPQNGGGSIPSNLIEAANTASNTHYLKACRELDVDPHPARFPRKLPEFFIKLLTPNPPYDDDERPTVLDIFAGSNLTGRVAEDLERNWLSFEQQEQYVQTSQFRFLTMAEIKKQVDEAQSDFDDFAEVEPDD